MGIEVRCDHNTVMALAMGSLISAVKTPLGRKIPRIVRPSSAINDRKRSRPTPICLQTNSFNEGFDGDYFTLFAIMKFGRDKIGGIYQIFPRNRKPGIRISGLFFGYDFNDPPRGRTENPLINCLSKMMLRRDG